MGVIKEFHEFWEWLPKNSIIKVFICIVLLFILLFFAVILWKSISGEPVKIFGIEFNQKISSIDKPTVKDTSKGILKSPISKSDNGLKINKVNSPQLSKKHIAIKKTSPTFINKKDTSKTTAKYLITAPVTQSAIGDNASVTNNNYGVKQRELTNEELNNIVSKIPNKETQIIFEYYLDKETLKFAGQIYNSLLYNGYKINEKHQMMMSSQIDYGEITVKTIGINKVVITVNPSGNVQ